MSIAIGIHVLAAIIWVGGMFFAHIILRPAVADLEPAQRLSLFRQLFKRFFLWVWVSIAALLASGYWIVFAVYNGFASLPVYSHLMNGIGWLMFLLFLHLWFALYRKFKQAMAADDTAEVARRLGQIRLIVTVNLVLGLINSVVGASGIYF